MNASVLDWFKSISNKSNHHVILFDVVKFYPSISEKKLPEAIKFDSKQNKERFINCGTGMIVI